MFLPFPNQWLLRAGTHPGEFLVDVCLYRAGVSETVSIFGVQGISDSVDGDQKVIKSAKSQNQMRLQCKVRALGIGKIVTKFNKSQNPISPVMYWLSKVRVWKP